MSETSIETEFQPDESGKLSPQTQEDKFFGVQHEVVKDDKEIDVEVVDDTPEEDRRPPKVESEKEEETPDDDVLDQEIADYSKRAGDRINKLKYEFHEERRAKESALKQSEEAAKRLKTLMTDNQRLQQMVEQGSEVLNTAAVNNAAFARQAAQEKFKKAYDEGDTTAMAEAQAELSKAAIAEAQAPQYAQQIQNQVAQQAPQEMPQFEVDDMTQDWANRNAWFMGQTPADKKMTSYALYLDQTLQSEGVNPKSEQYFQKIDDSMRKQFPDYFGVSVEETQEKTQPSSVVAPVTRNTGNKQNPRSVRLTQTQVKLAQRLGITPEQYAKQLLKES